MLAFWFDAEGRAVHVEFCLDDKLAIGASGSGWNIKTVQEAVRQNAYIMVRPIAFRGGWIRFADPFNSESDLFEKIKIRSDRPSEIKYPPIISPTKLRHNQGE